MPLFDLVLTIEDECNVAALSAVPGRHWPLKIRCLQCNESTKNFIFVDGAEQIETEGGGVRNCAFKCNFCKGTITADVLPGGSGVVDVAKVREAGRELSGVVVSFDFRGGEPEELRLDDQWNVTSDGGQTFDAVDLSTDWCEFDEKAGVPVTLSGVSADFVKGKGKK